MLIEGGRVKNLLDQYNITIRGILHVGAHRCEEKGIYNSWGIQDDHVVWVDANPDLIQENIKNGIPNCFCAALDETCRNTTFKITNNGESSSLLDFGLHSTYYPHIKFINEIQTTTQTLEDFVKNNNLNMSNYNFWNFDIQGSEYAVFKGSKEYLKYADCIYVEVNTDEVYKGCGKLNDLDALLKEYGLERVCIEMTAANWGDAIYVRK